MKRRLQEMYVPDRPIEVAYRTTEGDAAEAILPFSEEIACDLVVLGTHGRTGLPRLLSGSVAESVLRNARCPVLAIRQANRPAMAAATEIILHPTDFSESSHAALKVARALAQSRGARLVLLHVMPLETVMYGIAPTAYETEAACDSLTSLASELDGPDLKHPVGKLLAQGNAAAEIVRVAGEAPRSLIVMGTSGRSGLSRLLMGNVAESVLKKASCPVLMVKAPHPHASPSQAKPYSDGLAV